MNRWLEKHGGRFLRVVALTEAGLCIALQLIDEMKGVDKQVSNDWIAGLAVIGVILLVDLHRKGSA